VIPKLANGRQLLLAASAAIPKGIQASACSTGNEAAHAPVVVFPLARSSTVLPWPQQARSETPGRRASLLMLFDSLVRLRPSVPQGRQAIAQDASPGTRGLQAFRSSSCSCFSPARGGRPRQPAPASAITWTSLAIQPGTAPSDVTTLPAIRRLAANLGTGSRSPGSVPRAAGG
jgi:hypothetical protein